MPRLASVRMKAGTDIQNCASRTGRRFGTMCRHNKRSPELPDERANNMKSELRKERASAQTTRAAAAHPRHPSRRNVMAAETIGDTLHGIRRRTVVLSESQGKDREKTVTDDVT